MGKAQIKQYSTAPLAGVAKLMDASKNLTLYIVGQTDNPGESERNLQLPQKGAEAVVSALASEYKVDAKRMQARGAANFSPVASNGSDAGRARNHRVGQVEQ